jgi:hypothetical protein
MSDADQPIQLPLTEEQQELIHRVTGEHAYILEIVPDTTDKRSGTGCGLRFNWRISVDSGIPRQQWILNSKPRRAPDEGASA